MKEYIFHIGSNKNLAIAEISSVFGIKAIKAVVKDTVLISTLNLDDPQAVLNKLGGVIAIYEILEKKENLDVIENVLHFLDKVDLKNKLSFALSSNFEHSKDILEILKNIKKNLKKESNQNSGLRLRFLEGITAASVKFGGDLNQDLFIFSVDMFNVKSNPDKFVYLSKMIAIQDIDAYSLRDYEKPYRSAKLGMLPPKLSQIMLNLAVGSDFLGKNEKDKNHIKTIYDPFCGTGTILMEGLLHDFKVQGSDLVDINVNGSLQNLEWLCEKFEIEKNLIGKIFEKNAVELEVKDLENVDWIVTEGFLGKPKQGNEADSELMSELMKLENLYYEFLKAVALNWQGSNLKVVITLPVYKSNEKGKAQNFYMENLVEKCKKLGYIEEALISDNDLGLKLKASVLYKRSDQKVYRQVIRLSLKK